MGAWIETHETLTRMGFRRVAPYMGAWIETPLHLRQRLTRQSLPIWERGLKQKIADYFGVTIESLPIWERGLKPENNGFDIVTDSVAPYMGAWIETSAESGIESFEFGRSLYGSVD